MHAHILQHVPFETAGSIAAWLREAGATLSTTHVYEPHELPPVRDIDLLIVMGGPMSANDEARLPWLATEKRLIRSAIDSDRRVLGICLGAQLIASALGARVYPNGEKEIGWFPVSNVPGVGAATLPLPDGEVVFHWHGETFDLPAGAVHLARSEACAHQAFQVGSRVVGLQFHLEMTREGVETLVDRCGAELVPAAHVQSAERILQAGASRFARLHRVMGDVLAYVCRSMS